MTCELCASSSCRYDYKRLCCCVRALLDSRPSKQRQEGMLYVMSRTPGAPDREAILEAVRASNGT